MPHMLDMRGLSPTAPLGFTPEVAALFARLQQQVQDQALQLSERDAIAAAQGSRDCVEQAKVEKINFELARLKR